MKSYLKRYAVVSAGILCLLVPLTMLSGCGQDRPGVRFGEDHDAGPDNMDFNNPERAEAKLNHLKFLITGNNANKAERAAKTLGDMGASAEGALDVLKEYSDHPIEDTKTAINEAIKKIEADIAAKQGGGNG